MIAVNKLVFLFSILSLSFQIMAQKNNTIQHKEIIYKTIGQDDLVLHVFSSEISTSLAPVVVFLHPGGWVMGSPNSFFEDCKYYAKEGQVTVSVEYKFANFLSRSPMDCVKDVVDALIYLEENAASLGIDMAKLSIVGYSAGAHLALMSQLLPDIKAPVAQQLILYSTPVDLREDKLAPQLVHGEQTLESISPVTYNKKIPSKISMFHGEADFMVSYDFAKSFVAASKEMGNDINLYAYPDVNHFLLSNGAKDEIQKKTKELLAIETTR
jgi:acetyl esterase/lipase